jgi:hypothetical protein
MNRIFVKPQEGMKVRMPAADGGSFMRAEGQQVKDSVYWRRRLKEGSVVEASAKPEPKSVTKKTTKDSKE